MSTNLVILYPDVPFNSTILASDVAKEGFPIENTVLGDRIKHYKENVASTSLTIEYDLGAGNTAQPVYLAIARADLTAIFETSADISITLSGATDAAFTTPEDESATYGVTDLIGSLSEDFIFNTIFSSPFRYWRIIQTTTDSIAQEISKFYFGAFFDFDHDPIFEEYQSEFGPRVVGARKLRRAFTLVYNNILEAKKIDFMDKIGKHIDTNPVFFYDQNDKLFNGDTMIHAKIKDVSYRALDGNDEWDITLNCEELT